MRNKESWDYSFISPDTPKSSYWISSILLLIFSAAEIYFISAYFQQKIGLTTLFSTHGGLIVGLAVALGVLRSLNFDVRLLAIYLLLLLFFGPFGILLSFLIHVLYQFYYQSVDETIELMDSIFPEVPPDSPSQVLFDRLTYGYESVNTAATPIPFVDILTYGSFKKRRKVIEVILREFKPEFAPLLFTGLEDSNNAIRVQSGTALSLLENGFNRKIMLLHDLFKKTNDYQVLLEYAKACEVYAISGVIRDIRKTKALEKALKTYFEYERHFPKHHGIRLNIGRVYSLLGKYEQAVEVLRPLAIDENGLCVSVFPWLCESLYHLNCYSEIRELVRIVDWSDPEVQAHSRSVREVYSVWKEKEGGHVLTA